MPIVNVTELRKSLPEFLTRAERGEQILVTRRGKVIARIVPAVDRRQQARDELRALRKRARIGDVESPVEVEWDVHAGS